MLHIRFFSRVAFICNICFLLAVIIQGIPRHLEGEVVSTTIILGYVLAVFVNATVNIWCGVLFFSGKLLNKSVPIWLLIANFLFLIPELILFLK